jgi:2-polyprenyl-6-methoxyphenol hydroxylase-like FAD-dependent oxidoreductase
MHESPMNKEHLNPEPNQRLNASGLRAKQVAVIPGSSVVEQTVVSRPVAGSNPVPGSQFFTDIAIVGGGLAGSLAAVVLGRAGHRVLLIDRWAEYPSEFRVEKIAGDQAESLRKLGMLDCIKEAATAFEEIINIHRGQVIDRTYSAHYGILYSDLVGAVRAQPPQSVAVVVDRVADIQNSQSEQRLTLASGDRVEARLLVLATGMSDVLRRKLGVVRRTLFERHSISFGFSIAPSAGASFDFPALTCYGERASDGIDYLSLFPIGDLMRANLFTFRDHRDPWIRELRQNPRPTLLGAMPGLRPYVGDFEVTEPVQNWVMDLYKAENYCMDGVVLIGDAFQTSCPAAGTGVSRLLKDVDRLLAHAPQWLATPGMEAAKVKTFYDDREKRASDRRALRLAGYRRSLTIGSGFGWEARRRQMYLRRRLIDWTKHLKGAALLRRRRLGGAKAHASLSSQSS